MNGTIRIEDMRLFAKVTEAKSFTAAARLLGMPKQTLSRRVADLERALGVQLMHRTTRRLHLSDVGAAYAERCAEIVRIADEANHAVSDADAVPRGTLRITADPVFGEACASPTYIARCGVPAMPEDLQGHQCLLAVSDGTPMRWPFRGKKGTMMVPVSGRLTFTSFEMARAAALAGLGIALFLSSPAQTIFAVSDWFLYSTIGWWTLGPCGSSTPPAVSSPRACEPLSTSRANALLKTIATPTPPY